MEIVRFVIVAHGRSETNDALAGAAASLGLPALVLPPRDALAAVDPADIVLGRLRIRADLDGIEPGLTELEQLAAAGAVVLNSAAALVAAHDRHLTARLLRRAGVPHPRTWLLGDGMPSPAPELPVVLHPRFGSFGRPIRYDTPDELEEALALLPHLRDHGVIAQEVLPDAPQRRLVVAGGAVLVEGPPLARLLALEAASALGCELLGVTLRPQGRGFVVTAVDAAVELEPAPPALCRALVHELARAADLRREAA